MHKPIHFLQADGEDRLIGSAEVARALDAAAFPVLVDMETRGAFQVYQGFLRTFGRMVDTRRALRQERRIETLMDGMLDLDPFDEVEAGIDIDNAALRARFLEEFPTLTSAAVHARAGNTGRNSAQTAAAWKKAGRVLALPHRGKDLFPAFQFDADGQPLALMKPLLAALPADLTPWQRAFWLVAPDFRLDGARPVDLMQAGDRRCLDAAAQAGQLPIG